MLQTYQSTVSMAQILSVVHIPLNFILLSYLTSLRFALPIYFWNQLTVHLFPGMRASSGSLPIDRPFNPVVRILPVLTDTEQFQFGCFKVLARVIRKVRFTYSLCGPCTAPGIRSVMWLWASGGRRTKVFGRVAKTILILGSIHTLHLTSQ